MAKRAGAFGTLERAWRAPEAALRAVLDGRSAASVVRVRAHLDLDAVLSRLADLGVAVLLPDDPRYPDALHTLHRPPGVLYVAGDPSLLATRSVAVVGTRRASEYGRRAARRLAGDLAAAGLTIVSGLALGIDSVAHEAALRAAGTTIAVLGCGLDVVYPASNRRLRSRILDHGALLTEYPPGAQPQPGNFPARNRIVSGLSLAVVVIEAGRKSGALITARCALDQGRDVFAVPGSIFRASHAGANALLAAGAGVALTADEVLTALDLSHLAACRPAVSCRPSDPVEAAILDYLGDEPVHIDALSVGTGIDSAAAARALSMLEIRGLVENTGGMRWVAAH